MKFKHSLYQEMRGAVGYAARKIDETSPFFEPDVVNIVCAPGGIFKIKGQAREVVEGLGFSIETPFPFIFVTPEGGQIFNQAQPVIKYSAEPRDPSLVVDPRPMIPYMPPVTLPAIQPVPDKQGMKIIVRYMDQNLVYAGKYNSHLNIFPPIIGSFDSQALVIFDNSESVQQIFPFLPQPLCLTTARVPLGWPEAFSNGLLPHP